MSNRFDVVLANPPYKQGLFRTFMEISLEKLTNENGIIVQVSPDDTNPINRKNKKTMMLMKEYGLQLIVPSGHHFNVTVSAPIVTYYFDKSKPVNETVFDRVLSIEEQLTASIIQKIRNKQSLGKFGHKTAGTPPEKGNLETVTALSSVTKAGPVWKDLPKSEVRFINNGQDYFFVNQFYGMNARDLGYKGQGPIYISSRIFAIDSASGYTEDEFNEIFNIKPIKFLLGFYRGTNLRAKGWSLQEIPLIPVGILDYNKFFEFSNKEIEHINRTIK